MKKVEKQGIFEKLCPKNQPLARLAKGHFFKEERG
jgi:hypothetical protein